MSRESGERERRVAALVTACRRVGLRLTQQRLAIFRALAASEEHPDAEVLLRAVRPELPTVSLDTVYRTVATFVRLGVAAPLGPRREAVRFDPNMEPHHHYVCLACGLTRDFESAALRGLQVPRAARRFGTVSAMRVEVRGLCAQCARRTMGRPAKARRPRRARRAPTGR